MLSAGLLASTTAVAQEVQLKFVKDEYDEVKPLVLAPMTGNRIHTRTPIGDVSALSGKKAGKTLGDDFGMIAGLIAITAWRFGF